MVSLGTTSGSTMDTYGSRGGDRRAGTGAERAWGRDTARAIDGDGAGFETSAPTMTAPATEMAAILATAAVPPVITMTGPAVEVAAVVAALAAPIPAAIPLPVAPAVAPAASPVTEPLAAAPRPVAPLAAAVPVAAPPPAVMTLVAAVPPAVVAAVPVAPPTVAAPLAALAALAPPTAPLVVAAAVPVAAALDEANNSPALDSTAAFMAAGTAKGSAMRRARVSRWERKVAAHAAHRFACAMTRARCVPANSLSASAARTRGACVH